MIDQSQDRGSIEHKRQNKSNVFSQQINPMEKRAIDQIDFDKVGVHELSKRSDDIKTFQTGSFIFEQNRETFSSKRAESCRQTFQPRQQRDVGF